MFGFGKKIGMTTLFLDEVATSVTALEFGEQIILQSKTKESDGYDAVQVSFGKRRKTRQSTNGHTQKYAKEEFNPLFVGEFKIQEEDLKEKYNVEDFQTGDFIDLTGKSKGKGFTGVIKRYNFGGQPASHGHEHKKARGSIGAMYPQRVLPGTKMSGREGSKTITLKKVKIVAIDTENKLIFVKGSVPGTNGGFVKIKKVNK